MTLNDPKPRFHYLTLDISETVRNSYNAISNTDLHMPYLIVSFRMTLSDLEWCSVTRCIALSLCDSWVYCTCSFEHRSIYLRRRSELFSTETEASLI